MVHCGGRSCERVHREIEHPWLQVPEALKPRALSGTSLTLENNNPLNTIRIEIRRRSIAIKMMLTSKFVEASY